MDQQVLTHFACWRTTARGEKLTIPCQKYQVRCYEKASALASLNYQSKLTEWERAEQQHSLVCHQLCKSGRQRSLSKHHRLTWWWCANQTTCKQTEILTSYWLQLIVNAHPNTNYSCATCKRLFLELLYSISYQQ